jgi:hypothetical protein
MTIIDLYMARRRWSPLHFISKDLHIRRSVYTRRSGRELRADCCQFNPPLRSSVPIDACLSLSACLTDSLVWRRICSSPSPGIASWHIH